MLKTPYMAAVHHLYCLEIPLKLLNNQIRPIALKVPENKSSNSHQPSR